MELEWTTRRARGAPRFLYGILVVMTTATLLKKAAAKDKGVVVLPVKEYQRLIAAAVPTYYLSGKEATDLDKLVEEGLREYRAGKTFAAPSMGEALKRYRKQERIQKPHAC